jgi:RING finger protein 113A
LAYASKKRRRSRTSWKFHGVELLYLLSIIVTLYTSILSEMADTADPIVSFKKRGNKAKTNLRKREATPPPSDSDSGFTSSEDEGGHKIKRRRKNATVAASSAVQKPPRSEESQATSSTIKSLTNKDDATKTEDWYDEQIGQKKAQKQANKASRDSAPDGTYKGAANYASFIQKNPDRENKMVGPQKGSSNVRTITVTDFAPDVCKDYKQTGFCGFGDSCKFLHAREDYAQGWQLDREWEINTKGKPQQGKTVASANRNGQLNGDEQDDEALLESIPFACIICKGPYKSPIVTKCGHYFCEACALKRYRKDPSCAACGTGTGGVFNVAKKLNKLLERKRERAQEKGDAIEEPAA